MKKFGNWLVAFQVKAVGKTQRLRTGLLGNYLKSNRGEAYVDMAVKILIGVVVGALLLSGLYALFGDVVMPKLAERIGGMFDYQ